MNKKLEQVQKEALALCAPVFHEMEEISLYNTEKVLSAFRKHHLSAYHLLLPTATATGTREGKSWKKSGAIYSTRKAPWSDLISCQAPTPWLRSSWLFLNREIPWFPQ